MPSFLPSARSDGPLYGEESPCGITLERRWLADRDGALTTSVAYTNVAPTVGSLSTPEFDWGNYRPGCYDLALHVLEAALVRLSHAGPRSGTHTTSCFTLALFLRARFVSEILAAVPSDGADICWSVIENWIAKQISGLDDVQATMIAPRYALIGGNPLQHWTMTEAEELVGERLTVHAGGLHSASGQKVAHVLEPHPLNTASWEILPL